MTDSGHENEGDLLQTMDAKVWAREFCRCTKFPDEAWAVAWMANAIMTGWDHAHRRVAEQLSDAGHEDAAEIAYPGWKLLKELRSTTA